jgi:hypothetical protein
VLDPASTHARQTTLKEHMPPHHQRASVSGHPSQRLRTRAEELGPGTVQLVGAADRQSTPGNMPAVPSGLSASHNVLHGNVSGWKLAGVPKRVRS